MNIFIQCLIIIIKIKLLYLLYFSKIVVFNIHSVRYQAALSNLIYTQSHSVPDEVNICLTLLTEFFHRCYTIKNIYIKYINIFIYYIFWCIPFWNFLMNHLCCLIFFIVNLDCGECIRIFFIRDNEELSNFFHGVRDMYFPSLHAIYSGHSAKDWSQGSSIV